MKQRGSWAGDLSGQITGEHETLLHGRNESIGLPAPDPLIAAVVGSRHEGRRMQLRGS